MRKVKLKMLFIAILIMAITLLPGVTSAVALQANPSTHNVYLTKAVDESDKYFREMEGPGGAMGLNESLNADLTSTKSNGIDVHMMKNTEYGAIAILSASGYGNPSNENAITTTTGNNTGVMIGGAEWTAEIVNVDNPFNERYRDIYGDFKRGDALGGKDSVNPGCLGWHGSTGSLRPGSDFNWAHRFFRGSGGIFGYGITSPAHPYSGPGHVARGVAVCGEGL